jgi:large-conductance mechanosensitive channel
MDCLEAGGTSLPLLTDERQFADAVMDELSRREWPAIQPQTARRKIKRSQVKPWYQQAVFHYGVAAAITFILMSAGVFQQVFAVSAHLTASTQREQQSSFSDRLLQKAVTVIDTIRLSEQRR